SGPHARFAVRHRRPPAGRLCLGIRRPPGRGRCREGAIMSDTPRPLTQLGRQAAMPQSPDQAVLETVPNPHPGTIYLVRFAAPEFTSLCPITAQPDFAHLVIDYVPDDVLVES